MGTNSTTDSASRRRARLLGLVAAGLAALGVLLLILGVAGQLTKATPHMRGFNAGQTVTVSERGMSVYSRQDAVREQVVCRAGGEAEARYTFERPVDTFAVDVSGTPFYEVARSPEGMPAGPYELACEGTDQSVYAGPRADHTVAPGLVGTAGVVAGILVLVLAAMLGAAALLTARGTRGGPGSSQAAPMGPYPYGPPERRAMPSSGTDPYAAPGQSFDPYASPPPDHRAGPPPAGHPVEPTRPLSQLPPPTGRPYGSSPEATPRPASGGGQQPPPGTGDRQEPDRRDDSEPDDPGTTGQRPRPWTW